ncbi:MAG: hypothetical protein ACOYNL_02370 [Rickettsiales bacterium]
MFAAMLRNVLIISCVFALTGCLSQSQVQAKYAHSQNICRVQTAQLFASNESLANSLDGQAQAGSAFGECMTKAGWRVATPKPAQPGTQVAQYPPSGAPSTNPSASVSSARVRPAENPPQQGQALVTAQQQTPPSGAPSTGPTAAAAKVAPQAQVAQVAQVAPVAQAAPAANTAPIAAAAPVAATASKAAIAPAASVAHTAPITQAQPALPSRIALPSVSADYSNPGRPSTVPNAPFGKGAARQF